MVSVFDTLEDFKRLSESEPIIAHSTKMLPFLERAAAGAAAPMLCRPMIITRLLGLAALVYGSGCVFAGFTPTTGVLLAVRLAQGTGGGKLLCLCYLAIHGWFAPS